MPVPCSAVATLSIAMICGTPTPATIRVVQMDPGPMPTLTASAPASASARAASPRGDVAADHVDLRIVLLDPAHALDHAGAVAVRGVDDDHVDAGLDQRLDALLGALAHANRGAHAQAAAGVARRIREAGLLGDVLDGDQALELPGAR